MKQQFDQKDSYSNFGEQFLRLNEDRFRLLVSGVKNYAIFMMDPAGHILTWNEGAKKLKGYEENEIIGKHFSIFYSEEDQKAGKPEKELVASIKYGQVEDEGWRLKKNGEKFWANVIITRMNDEKGNLIGFSKITRDLTLRKSEEEKLRMAYKELQNAVEGKTADLAAALVARDEFLMIASHELKTPLTSLKLRLQMGKRNLRPEMDKMPTKEELLNFYNQSLEQVDSLVRLVDDLLEVSRLQSGQFSLNKEDLNLSDLIHSVSQRFKDEKKIVFKITPGVTVHADKYRMDQVISNLLSNAIKHAPLSQIDVELNLSPDLKRAFFIVKDSGPGIEKEMQDKIFLRFARLSSYTHVGGMGLGLYMVKKIVEGHGGDITLLSAPGQGATFVVSLPVKEFLP